MLRAASAEEILVQAALDSPIFPVEWRRTATRALALLRMRGGRPVPAPIQRMRSDDLLACAFPDAAACFENIEGDRQVPDHPLVKQALSDCLHERMDVDGLLELLGRIERGEVRLVARDLPEPSVLCHEILNANPYAFLDDAPLEERRSRAVSLRRGLPEELAK